MKYLEKLYLLRKDKNVTAKPLKSVLLALKNSTEEVIEGYFCKTSGWREEMNQRKLSFKIHASKVTLVFSLQ